MNVGVIDKTHRKLLIHGSYAFVDLWESSQGALELLARKRLIHKRDVKLFQQGAVYERVDEVLSERERSLEIGGGGNTVAAVWLAAGGFGRALWLAKECVEIAERFPSDPWKTLRDARGFAQRMQSHSGTRQSAKYVHSAGGRMSLGKRSRTTEENLESFLRERISSERTLQSDIVDAITYRLLVAYGALELRNGRSADVVEAAVSDEARRLRSSLDREPLIVEKAPMRFVRQSRGLSSFARSGVPAPSVMPNIAEALALFDKVDGVLPSCRVDMRAFARTFGGVETDQPGELPGGGGAERDGSPASRSQGAGSLGLVC